VNELLYEVVVTDGPGGRIMHVLPAVTADMPTALREALEVRRSATITGRCGCGAAMVIDRDANGDPAGFMEHEADCPADDATIRKLIENCA
jgi:hypothetical protein